MERVLRNTPATISQTFYNGSSAVEADGVVSVVIKRADGTTLLSTSATNDPAVGVYKVVLPAQTTLNKLTLTWTGTFSGTVVSMESQVEIVGGFYFSIAELRGYDSTFQNLTRFPNDALIDARNEVEAEFEDICGRAFVPRYHKERGVETDPAGMIFLEKPEPITILSIKVNGTDRTSWATSDYLIRDTISPKTLLLRYDALQIASYDPLYYPVDMEYEYGMTQVPIPIKKKALKRAKQFLLGQNSTIDERALTMNLPDIGSVNLATPGVRGSETGVPDIDVVLKRYTLDSGGSSGAGVF